MSDTTEGQSEDAGGDPGGDPAGGPEVGGPLADVAVWAYLRLAAIGLLALLALLSTFRLYTSASSAIGRWVAPDFVPVFQAAFNLVVLLLALAGLAVLARGWRS